MLSQLQAIERTFWYQDRMTEESIRGMKHPTKKGVVAVDVSRTCQIMRYKPRLIHFHAVLRTAPG